MAGQPLRDLAGQGEIRRYGRGRRAEGAELIGALDRDGRAEPIELAINTFLTLDGVMQAPGGPEEDPTGGFTHGGWSVKYWDETMVQRIGASMSQPFDLLLGRRTYEIFAAHWPHVSNDPIADALNGATARGALARLA